MKFQFVKCIVANVCSLFWKLVARSERDVGLLDDVGTGEHTGASDTAEDVRACALHERHKALVLENLHTAVHTAVVLDGRAGRHHHASSDGVDRVGGKSGSDGDGPSEEERHQSAATVTDENRLERVVQTKVETSVDEDTDARDHEATVETGDTVAGQRLSVHVDEAVELALAALSLGVVGETSSRKVETVHDGERERTGEAARRDVGRELLRLRRVLRHLELRLDGVFERKVERLRWEVSEHVGQVTSPEWDDSLGFEDSSSAVDDASVRLVETALLDHLVLVLDEELDALDGRGGGLRDTGGDAREHKVFKES
jgi:hypothetical protein